VVESSWVSVVSWWSVRFEEIDLYRDVVLGDSGSAGRKWLQMRAWSQAVGTQGPSRIGGDRCRPGVIRYLACRSRCRLLSIRAFTAHRFPTSHQGWMSDEWQMSYRSMTNR
jgi:hypothetical protein